MFNLYFQRRGSKYSFIYYDPVLRKNVRLGQKETPSIKSDEEARKFSQLWDARLDSQKVRIQRKQAWAEKYQNFKELIEVYERTRQKEAPNSWHDCRSQMVHYVLPFFLDKKGENNVNNWHWYFEEFRDHLETVNSIRHKGGGKSGPLAYSTKNNVIGSLNAFINLLYRRRLIEHSYKCRQFENHLLNKRDMFSVIEPEMEKYIQSALRARDTLSSKFFHVLVHSGLRVNELFGASLADFSTRALESEIMRVALKPYDLEIYGYLAIDSQPAGRLKFRNEKGRVLRKPLKGKKSIDEEDCRIIPIFDRESQQILSHLWNAQQEAFQKGRYGSDPKDYLLFEGLGPNFFNRVLRQAQKALSGGKIFTPHDCRHTYATWLMETTGGNHMLARMILGHTDVEMTMRYVHIHARLQRQLRMRLQLMSPLDVTTT